MIPILLVIQLAPIGPVTEMAVHLWAIMIDRVEALIPLLGTRLMPPEDVAKTISRELEVTGSSIVLQLINVRVMRTVACMHILFSHSNAVYY